tara:strand:+ start:1503 stop:1967 length:465 start_codon:yes stop_codon:yes gene_type:complete
MFLIVSGWGQAQITSVNNKDLPILIDKDIISFDCEVWIESPDSEMIQRVKIMKLEKKISNVLDILHKKKGFELQVDSLVKQAVRVQKENDSLNVVISNNRLVINKDIESRVNSLSNEIDSIKDKYFEMRRSRNLWRRATIGSIGLNVIFLLLLF